MKRFQDFPAAGPKGQPPPGLTWEGMMAEALAAAQDAAQAGEVPVGAAVFDSAGQLLARAGNNVEGGCNPAGHAEILALAAACRLAGSPRLPGHILVVTLEPCLMCSGAIGHSRIDGVVFGAFDSIAGALVSAADRPNLPLAGRSFWHLGGIRSTECASLLAQFFRRRRDSSNQKFHA